MESREWRKGCNLAEEVERLLDVGLIRESFYPDWLANPILVKKPNSKWRTCVDFNDLNKACPKDSFPLPRINQLVNAMAGHALLCFMDVYSGYNQIPMYEPDQEHTSFITNRGLYCYIGMPFGLINIGATYQRFVNKMFKRQIGKTIEVYVDDMLLKSKREEDHIADLAEMFHILRKYRMKLNPQKCVFGVETGKFLGFMVNHRGIEANTKKIKALAVGKSSYVVQTGGWGNVGSLLGGFRILRQRGVGEGGRESPIAHALDDFIQEFDSEVDNKAIVLAESSSQENHPADVREEFPHPWWILHVNGAVNNNGAGAGIILVTPEGHRSMSAIHFKFYITNNDAEYEALINGLKIALEVRIVNLIAQSDSELVVNQVNGGFQVRGPQTELYMRCAQRLLERFGSARLEGVPREENSNADALEKMGSQMDNV
ncbi:uncharacterized protein LOC141685485 [Apium graveolens]|uniref:uncharacterized protein LOC141685485 n=1 Tax=Apium graveolens TaxID=4045 RepID=UPI003D7AF16C